MFTAILSLSANRTAVVESTEGKAQNLQCIETLYAAVLFFTDMVTLPSFVETNNTGYCSSILTLIIYQWAACHEFDHRLKSGGAKMGSELRRDADDVMDSENSQADDGNGELKQSNQGAVLCLSSSEKYVCLHLLIVMVIGWAAASLLGWLSYSANVFE